jgi:hypothetical protein
MAALHLYDPARCRDRDSISQQQDCTRALGQASGNTWSPQQAFEFLTLLGAYRYNPLVLCHWNILVHENLIFASLVSRL